MSKDNSAMAKLSQNLAELSVGRIGIGRTVGRPSNALGHLPLEMCSKLSAPCSNSPSHLPPGGRSLIIFLYSKFWSEISNALLKTLIRNEIVRYILKMLLNFQLWVCAFSKFPRNSLHNKLSWPTYTTLGCTFTWKLLNIYLWIPTTAYGRRKVFYWCSCWLVS